MWWIKKIKKPKFVHQCEFCRQPIEGAHLALSGVYCGDFWAFRAHKECHEAAIEMCNDCDYSCGCEYDISECFFEKYLR